VTFRILSKLDPAQLKTAGAPQSQQLGVLSVG